MEPLPQQEPAPESVAGPPRRSRFARTLLIGALSIGLFYAAGALVFAMRQRIRTAFSTLDARLDLRLEGGDAAVADQTWKILAERLRRSNLPGKLNRGEGGLFTIEHRAQDADALRALATTRGDLRFMLVDDELSALEQRALFEQVRETRRLGGSLPPGAKRDALPFGHGVVVLERPGIGGAGTFARVFRTLDELKRPALGFELTPAAAKKFLRLTTDNVGRALAFVLDDEVRTVPRIRSAIGRRGIVEGGDRGWGEAELDRMVLVLGGDPLPAPLISID